MTWSKIKISAARLDKLFSYLVFIRLLPEADWGLAGHQVQINVVVAADPPAAPFPCTHTLQLQELVVPSLPAPTGGGEAVYPSIHVHRPQQCYGHDGGPGEEGLRVESPIIHRLFWIFTS